MQIFNSCTSRRGVRQYLVVKNTLTCQENKRRTQMTHVACESKLRSVVRSFMHQCPWNWVAIGHAVVYYAHAFCAEMICRHCMFSYGQLLFASFDCYLSVWMLDVERGKSCLVITPNTRGTLERRLSSFLNILYFLEYLLLTNHSMNNCIFAVLSMP